MWDERYSGEDFAYGKEPNTFLVEALNRVKPETASRNGEALCLAEGEGRNAVFLARQGFEVTAVDQSRVGLAKAERLAAENGVRIHTECADLETYEPGSGRWDLIVSIWAHMPPGPRRRLHAAAISALRPGGYFILEAYRPENVSRGVGGPPDPALTMTRDALLDELTGLEVVLAEDRERDVREGRYHQGMSAVVQIILRKP